MNWAKSIILGLLLCVNLNLAWAQSPKTAAEFLAALPEGGSAGAGNGGGDLISKYYRDALVGLQFLKLNKIHKNKELKKIHAAITKNSKVYAVGFQLCPFDYDNTCPESTALYSKNYPERKIILVDGRDLPKRYRNMSLVEKRRHTTHEFEGLANIENNNHAFSTQIDAQDLYEKFSSRQLKKEYFAFLGSLFQALPGGDPFDYVGSWVKRTSFRPKEHELLKDPSLLLAGDKYFIEVSNQHKFSAGPPASSKYYVNSYNYRYDMNLNQWAFAPEITFSAPFKNEMLQLGDSDYRPWKRVLRRQAKRFPEMFSPLERSKNSDINTAPFTCKLNTENELFCRHFYYQWVPGSLVQRSIWILEYALYQRTLKAVSSFALPPK